MGNESVDILIQRAEVLRPRNLNQAFALLDDALSIAKKTAYKKGIAQVHLSLGVCHLQKNNYKKSLTEFNEACQLFETLGDKAGILKCLQAISSICFKLGDGPSALEHTFKSLRIYTENKDEGGIAACNNELGNIYLYLQEYEKAVEHYRKALKIFEEQKNKKEMVNSFFLLGNAYNWTDDFEKSKYYLLRSLNALDVLDDINTKVEALGSLATLHTKLKEYDKALNYFHEALDLANLGAAASVKAQLKRNLGNLYIDLTQYDKAIDTLQKALNIAQASALESHYQNIHQFLSIAYEKIGDFEKALHHFKQFYEADKHVTSEEINLKTRGLQIKFDLEELRKQKEIAELSDKLKEQFLANVSHEIRTPMNGVLGMAHLLELTNPSKEQQEYIDAIRFSAQNLMVIINDILDFSKINAGKIDFTETEFNLREVIKGIIQLLQIDAEEKNIQLSCVLDYHIKEVLIGDAMRLNQILINLMGNAVKFTDNGKVTLDVKVLEANEDKCTLRFRVIDTGIGIPENKLSTIFKSFEQVENSKRRHEGTGLGLTIVKKLVELQGGAISVKSKLNEGSEFTVDLSFKVSPAQSHYRGKPVEATIPKKDFSAIHILIVEDNKVNQLLVRNMLKNFGFTEVDTVENGKLALEKIQHHSYHLILMDIQMPEMSGHEITHHIRTTMPEPLCDIPIIALTADASEKEKTQARQAGMNDYIVKPYTPAELYATITRYLTIPAEKVIEIIERDNTDQGFAIESLEKYTGGDIELAIQLIEIFLRQLPEAIQKLETAIPLGDWAYIHSVAHKLKSSIAIFEFQDLRKILVNIEEYSRDRQNLTEIPNLFHQFKASSRSAIASLETELRKIKKINA